MGEMRDEKRASLSERLGERWCHHGGGGGGDNDESPRERERERDRERERMGGRLRRIVLFSRPVLREICASITSPLGYKFEEC
jgi:hypothetical protein